jgi:hypothetical protein
METNDYIKKLEEEVETLKNKLKSYTSPSRSKTYYEKNKEQIKQKVREYKEKTNYVYEVPPEKKKEYARTAYLNKKEKIKKEKDEKGKCTNELI